MGKKTNPTSNQSAGPEKKEPSETKPKRNAGKPTAKKKSTLTEKAVKAVAAVALGVGGAIAAKRKTRTSKKKETPAVEPMPITQASRPTAPTGSYSHEDIALRAYFLSEARRAAGLPADPHQDWLDAERELTGGGRHQTA